MSAIPVFEIGVWNAWIFMLINFLPMPILMRGHKGLIEESMKLYSEANRAVYYIEWICWALAFVYSIFLPIRLGTVWFYIGLPIALVGVVIYAIVIVSFATRPIGKEPVTTGLYRYSRHSHVHQPVNNVYRSGDSFGFVAFPTVNHRVLSSFYHICEFRGRGLP